MRNALLLLAIVAAAGCAMTPAAPLVNRDEKQQTAQKEVEQVNTTKRFEGPAPNATSTTTATTYAPTISLAEGATMSAEAPAMLEQANVIREQSKGSMAALVAIAQANTQRDMEVAKVKLEIAQTQERTETVKAKASEEVSLNMLGVAIAAAILMAVLVVGIFVWLWFKNTAAGRVLSAGADAVSGIALKKISELDELIAAEPDSNKRAALSAEKARLATDQLHHVRRNFDLKPKKA